MNTDLPTFERKWTSLSSFVDINLMLLKSVRQGDFVPLKTPHRRPGSRLKSQKCGYLNAPRS